MYETIPNQTFNLKQGEISFKQFQLTYEANSANANIADCTITGTLKKNYYTPNVSANLVCTKIDDANGILEIKLEANVSANLDPVMYVFDVRLENGALVYKPISGVYIVHPSTTS